MPDASSSAVKVGSVEVTFADGTVHSLPVHGVTPMQTIRLVDETGIKDWSELTQSTLATTRFMIKTVAEALSFEDQENWTVDRVERAFSDIVEIAKIFNICVSLSALPKVPDAEVQRRKQSPYH